MKKFIYAIAIITVLVTVSSCTAEPIDAKTDTPTLNEGTMDGVPPIIIGTGPTK